MTHILLVDDEPTVRRIMRLALEKAGFAVKTAENGEVALEQIRMETPDVLITDIEMPRMDGRALCAAVQKEFPGRNFPIFVVTSLTAHEHRQWSSTVDDLHFLEKPISVRQLLARLTNFLGAKTVVMETNE